MIYNKKLAVAVGAAAVALTGIVVFLICGAVGLYKGDETDTTKSTEFSKTTTAPWETKNTETSGDTEKEVPITAVNAVNRDGQYVVLDGEDVDVFLSGLAKATIDGKTELYYFDAGVFDPSYTGIALLSNATLGGKNQSYYVVNGIAQTGYTGSYSDAYTTYDIQNGIVQK